MLATGADLLEAVRRGESMAIESFVHEHESLVFNYVRRLLADSCDAEEIAQEAFLRAIRAVQRNYEIARIRDLAVRPWLLRIARNLALNRLRHNRARPIVVADVTEMEAVLAAPESGPDRSTDRLARALASLSDGEREVVVLRFIDDLNYAEVAATVGCTQSAARGRVFRALKRLRTMLTETDHEDVHLG